MLREVNRLTKGKMGNVNKKDAVRNIPIYRAKKIDSDEYVEGQLIDKHIVGSDCIESTYNQGFTACGRSEYDIFKSIVLKQHIYEIDPTTLAIHFPDLLDSEGNKIFASLREDGKGGDILKTKSFSAPCSYDDGFNIQTIVRVCNLNMIMDRTKVIGIQNSLFEKTT